MLVGGRVTWVTMFTGETKETREFIGCSRVGRSLAMEKGKRTTASWAAVTSLWKLNTMPKCFCGLVVLTVGPPVSARTT